MPTSPFRWRFLLFNAFTKTVIYRHFYALTKAGAIKKAIETADKTMTLRANILKKGD